MWWMAAAGLALSAVGGISQARSARKAAEYNAALEERNAVLAQQQAQYDATQQMRAAYKQLGAMRAGYGAAGVRLEGSPADIIEESAAAAELDRIMILRGGESRAEGFRLSAAGERAAGKSAQRSGYLSVAGSLLGGAGSLYSAGVPMTRTQSYGFGGVG